MIEIIIRLATKDDAELIADISRQTFYDTFASQNTKKNMDKFMNEKFSKEKLMEEMSEKGNIFFLAWHNDEPVGYLKMKETTEPIDDSGLSSFEIARIYSVRHVIGKGVGKTLMQTCIDFAKQKNKKLIWLGVWEKNQKAIDFYTRWGFEKFDEHDFVLGDDVQRDWLMKKILD